MIQAENTGILLFLTSPHPLQRHKAPRVGGKEQLCGVKIAWNPGRVRALCRQDGWEHITRLQERDLTSAGRRL